MHGDWESQTETWDSINGEFRWDTNIYETSALFGAKSGIEVVLPSVIFRVANAFGNKTGVTTDSKGSSFVTSNKLSMGSQVESAVFGIEGYESLSLGMQSSFTYKDYELLMYSFGSLGMASEVEAFPNTHTSLGFQFNTGSGVSGSPAGSIFHLKGELKTRTRLGVEEPNVDFVVAGSLGSKSGLTKAEPIVGFDTEISLGFKSGFNASVTLTIPEEVTLGMYSLVYAASGNIFFEDCAFNGVMSDKYIANYTARGVGIFHTQSGLDVESNVMFGLEELLQMGIGYTVRDGWWIRPIPGKEGNWNPESDLDKNWTADKSIAGTGWTSNKFNP